MRVITARSVSEALSHGLHQLRVHGQPQPSRVGDVLVNPYPVMTIYTHPTNRVLLSPTRDANPFFHVMEALWMLAGRNDLPWLTHYNKRFASYSDDGGETQPGAYGFRWRQHFGNDQLAEIIEELKRNPETRRAVLTMWDATGPFEGDTRPWPGDLLAGVMGSADVPCNTHAYFDTLDGRLNMTVCCRSNDIIWGAYGANAVHFSFLLEYMAAMTGLPMGVYRQMSNNYHLYTNVFTREQLMPLAREVEQTDPYLVGSPLKEFVSPSLRTVPLVANPETFLSDLDRFMAGEKSAIWDNTFFSWVAIPMRVAWDLHKLRNYDEALNVARTIASDDWRKAALEWLSRRHIKYDLNKSRFVEALDAVNEEDTNGRPA